MRRSAASTPPVFPPQAVALALVTACLLAGPQGHRAPPTFFPSKPVGQAGRLHHAWPKGLAGGGSPIPWTDQD